MANQTLSMDMKPCVVCKTPVDVDNGFGHISNNDVYCEKHGELGRIEREYVNVITKMKLMEKEATQLQNQYNEEYARVEGKKCNFVRYTLGVVGWVTEATQREKKGKREESTRLVIVTKKMEQNDFTNLCTQMGGQSPDAKIIFNIKVDKERLETQKMVNTHQ